MQFQTTDTISAAARSRITDLLESHPLYPEIEL